jgi:hypothetical protein
LIFVPARTQTTITKIKRVPPTLLLIPHLVKFFQA